jgi:hypothetical protein
VRPAFNLLLTMSSGAIFLSWLLSFSYLITGRSRFGGGRAIEYVSFALIGLASGVGLYLGGRELLARSPRKTSQPHTGGRRETNGALLIVGWVLMSFGILTGYTLSEIWAQTKSFEGVMWMVFGSVFCLALGSACLIAFRPPRG